MKRAFASLIFLLAKCVLWLRYRITIKGMERLTPETLKRPGGILFLANHPAEIDPPILETYLWHRFHPHPVAVETTFRNPVVRFFLHLVDSFAVPSFEDSSNSYKRKLIEKLYAQLIELLHRKENLLVYPAGYLQRNGVEEIGGASGVHQLLQNCPDANVVLIRTTGLWGSSFSKALTGKSPDVMKIFWEGFKIILKNGIFFTPRRKVLVEIEPAPEDFPIQGSRLELNRYLERWLNAKGPEPLTLVSFSIWKEELPEVTAEKGKEEIPLEAIPEEIRQGVLEEIAQLTQRPVNDIKSEDHLARDLGMDSLDIAQIILFLREAYGVISVHSSDLTTVESVMAFAAGLRESSREEEEEEKKISLWHEQKGRPLPEFPEGKTLQEAFLQTCDRMKAFPAGVDAISGEVSYRRFKIGAILLAKVLSRFPDQRLGILLPASVAVNLIIFATLLAKKVPVLINWTLGARNLKAVIDQSNIEKTLSSWNFLDRLENADLNGIDDQIVLLEELRKKISLWQKLQAWMLSYRSARSLMNYFDLDRVNEEDHAVILFTSGTENVPKGVPLSHRNLLSNERAAFNCVSFEEKDVLIGILPPFHSFGLSVTGILPILAGLRIAFYPNPTDGRRIAFSVERWNVTLLASAPTFLKTLLRVAKEEQLKTLRLVVTGAEKTPAELYDKLRELNPKANLLEGYGITECGPILTLNIPDKKKKGVGLPLPGVELLVVHPETLEPQAVGTVGLILARGPNIFKGYLDPRFGSPFVEVSGKQWYQTGDLGSIDQEGYLTLAGRLKRFVKIGGEMISLTAIEEVLLEVAAKKGWKLKPDTPSFAVIASEEEGKKGEIVLFTIVPTTVDEVNQELKASGMSNLIRVSKVQHLNTFPLLGTGKIDYRTLASKLKGEKK